VYLKRVSKVYSVSKDLSKVYNVSKKCIQSVYQKYIVCLKSVSNECIESV